MAHLSHTPNSRKTHSPTTRLDLRLSQDYKSLLQQAADLRGETLTEFVVSASAMAANQVLQEEQILKLSKRDQELLVDYLLSDAKPGKKLRAAAASYHKRTKRT